MNMTKKSMTQKQKPKVDRPKLNITCMVNDVCAAKGVSVYAVAKSIGMHPNQMYPYTSNRAFPNLETAFLISKALETPVDQLWLVDINK